MEEMDTEERKNKKIGLITTIGFHAILLLLFFFLLAWSEPDPPIPEYGIELSFVQSNSKGKVESDQEEQSQQESTDAEDQTQEPSEEEPVEEVVEEQVEEEAESSESEEQAVEEAQQTSAEESSEVPQEAEVIESDDVNSPDIVEETKEATKEVEEKPKENTAEAIKTTVSTRDNSKTGKSESEESAEQPKIDSRAIYTGSKGDTNAQSSSGGSSLDMSGWVWDFEPEPDDQSQESGKIVFQITVDDEGVIIGVRTLEKTVSPAVEKKYRDAVYELTFSKTAENRSTAATSKGKVTFIIKSR